MANPQPEDGTTRINQAVLEKLLLYPFPAKTALPLKLILFVMRKTWGYAKKRDRISLTQFQKATNAGRANVVHWLKYLVSANILVSASEPLGNVYGFNKDYDTWVVSASELVSVPRRTSFSKRTKTSIGTETHKRKKETIQKKVYGKFKNVLLKEKEYTELVETFGKDVAGDKINTLSEYIASKGKKYKSHYATILIWERKQNKEKKKTNLKYLN